MDLGSMDSSVLFCLAIYFFKKIVLLNIPFFNFEKAKKI
jgi:hypothetical protein